MARAPGARREAGRGCSARAHGRCHRQAQPEFLLCQGCEVCILPALLLGCHQGHPLWAAHCCLGRSAHPGKLHLPSQHRQSLLIRGPATLFCWVPAHAAMHTTDGYAQPVCLAVSLCQHREECCIVMATRDLACSDDGKPSETVMTCTCVMAGCCPL